jgi:antitoxin (DNA-binding transcriptional repressor) of toxin-antitoxin stability system
MTTKRMKSDQVRTDWKNVLQYVRQGGTVIVEHYNEPIATITPYEEPTAPTTYTASIGLVSSVVAGDYCDLAVNENQIVAAREDDYGNEIPVTEPTGPMVLDTVELGDARTDDPDSEGKAYDAADGMLDDHGWRRVGPWNAASGDAAYAPVERA